MNTQIDSEYQIQGLGTFGFLSALFFVFRRSLALHDSIHLLFGPWNVLWNLCEFRESRAGRVNLQKLATTIWTVLSDVHDDSNQWDQLYIIWLQPKAAPILPPQYLYS